MDGFSFNRAALNGSVKSVVAGAALAIASCGVSATGTRVVTDIPQFVATCSVTSTFTYYAMGAANVVSGGTMQATPGLLYTSTAKFGTGGALTATNTESYFAASGSMQATGTDVQNGSAAFVGNSIGTTAIPLYIAGTAALFGANGAMSADASTTPNGSSYSYRDGYVNTVPVGGTFTASALRTALCFANPAATSNCIAMDGLIQGGFAQFTGGAVFSATGAADAGWMIGASAMTALGQVTQNPTSILLAGTMTVSAAQNVLTQGTVSAVICAGMFSATCNLGIQSGATFAGATIVGATGATERLGGSSINASGSMTALGGLLQQGQTAFVASASLAANPLVNADSIDPPERTMIRPLVDRVMLRPHVDRTMQKEP